MKKLWKKGLPALILLVFGVVAAGCDNGTTSSSTSGDSAAVAAQKFANELDRLFEGSGYAESGSEEGVVLVAGSPVLHVRLDSKNPNVTKNIDIPAGVTLRLAAAAASLTLSSRSTLAENVGKATFVIKGKGTLELTAAKSLVVDSGDADQTSPTGTVTSYLVIENGVTIKFSSASQSDAIINGALTTGDLTGTALPGDQITWKTGAKVFAGKDLDTSDINGEPTQDSNIILDFIVQGKDSVAPVVLNLYAGDKIGSLTINKNGTIATNDTSLEASETIVISKVTVNGKKAGAVDIGGEFAPESADGQVIVAGDIVVNDDGTFSPVDQIVMGKVYLNGKAIATTPTTAFDFSELYIAKDATLDVASVALTPATVSVKLDNKGKINLAAGTMLELTVDPRNKQTHVNEGTITITSGTASLTGGVTLENKGTIKFAGGAKGLLTINDNSKVINSKIIDLVEAAGSIKLVPTGDSYPTLSFASGSELQGIYLAKTSGSLGTNITEATLRNYDVETSSAPVTPANLTLDDFYLAFDAYTGVSPYGTAVNVNRVPAEPSDSDITAVPSGYLKFKKTWEFNPEGEVLIGDLAATSDEAVTGITLTFEEATP